MLSTSQKVFLATILSTTIRKLRAVISLPSVLEVNRGGLNWQLDLKEGIDLSIYLFGGFELSTRRYYQKRLSPGSTVIDIGANIGAHTLPLAEVVGPSGRVIAFEPTQFAFGKLIKNISLNENLSSRIIPVQAMLVSDLDTKVSEAIYSSWPVDGSKDVHSQLRGRLMDTAGSVATTLDKAIEDISIDHIDFIKLDVDGHELEVLKGAKKILGAYSPVILMELAPYAYSNPVDFDQVLQLIWDYGYHLENIDTGASLPCDLVIVKNQIPKNGAINVWASTILKQKA